MTQEEEEGQNELIRKQRETIDKAQEKAIQQQKFVDNAKIAALYAGFFVFICLILYAMCMDIISIDY